ncbi:low specificity L-threonine aldolase [Sneathiella marina]|uniref:L-threonine aldolase n=1 Tax=Sneathiella marina TaxID=2950108 RepID=A0ABY4W747_9PROT|nr:low specificity L-threonine aldolase [Sneathiella marina]USG62724.1 low specificity L-threonine aldolase [Sneathiella marina]
MDTNHLINFASDNSAPVAPEIMAALLAVNQGPALGYGNDSVTRGFEEQLKDVFECDLRAFPVATGTAANALGLSVMVPPYGSIFAHRLGHIETDECGAPEFYTGGAKIALQDGENGKLDAAHLDKVLSQSGAGNVHHIQPAVLSLTQTTECGTVYTEAEVAALSATAKAHGLGVHMDGARFANAVVSLDCAPADVTVKAGVDILSLGATKNGAMAVEAVVFFNQEKAQEFEFRRKRGAHLFSKMRYFSAQLDAYFADGLWLKFAHHANEMASRLAAGLASSDTASLLYPVEANMVFTKISGEAMAKLEKSNVLFYPEGPKEDSVIRLVASWNTTSEEVDAVLSLIG